MPADVPPSFGGEPAVQPPAGPWTAPNIGRPARRAQPWVLALALALTAVVAVAALVVALTRTVRAPIPPAAPRAPEFSPAQTAAAQQQLCDYYKLAAKAVQVDTAGTDKALARIATTNAALMLDTAARNPALGSNDRDVARALEAAYLTVTAKSSYGVATEDEFQAALNDVIAKDAAMKKVCGAA